MTELEILKQQGYLIIEDVIDPDEFATLIRELEETIDTTAKDLVAAGCLRDTCPGEPFERRLASLSRFEPARLALWRSVQGKHHKSEGLFNIITHSKLLDRVALLIGNEILAHPQFNIRAILPDHIGNIAPWHQDSAYLGNAAAETLIVNFWIPLQDTGPDLAPLEV